MQNKTNTINIEKNDASLVISDNNEISLVITGEGNNIVFNQTAKSNETDSPIAHTTTVSSVSVEEPINETLTTNNSDIPFISIPIVLLLSAFAVYSVKSKNKEFEERGIIDIV